MKSGARMPGAHHRVKNGKQSGRSRPPIHHSDFDIRHLNASFPAKATFPATMHVTIRPATAADLDAINAIYNHYVEHSTCTYQTVPTTAEERRDWFEVHGPEHPVIVAEEDGVMVGWGSLSRFHPRQAYCHSVEDSVYLHHEHQGRGHGSLLLGELLRLAKEIGHHTVLGGIDAEQKGSIALHAKFGFEKVSHLKEVGFKQGRWLDVIWMQKML
jgi:phosphinothricin acetyltransferase